MMNMVLAFLPPHRLDRVVLLLHRLPGFPGMTVTQAKGHGREKLEDEYDDGAELTDFTPAVRIEVIVGDDLVEPVVTTRYEATHTGARGDGKVYVLPATDALRIKTGARGEEAV
jgi:nitrogen regulatory protein P-II 1